MAIALGLAIGEPSSGSVTANQQTLAVLTNVAVFLIVHPMMINLKLKALLQAGKNAKGLSFATLYNFIWARMLGSGTTSS